MESPQAQPTPSSSMSGFTRRPPAPDHTEVDDEEARSVLGNVEATTPAPPADLPPGERPYTYEERVKTFGLSIEEALKIVDDMALGGAYRENVRLSKSIMISFTTRSTRFNSFLTREIDLADPKKMGRMNQLMSEWQLAASIEQYGDQPMAPLSDEMKDDVYAKVLNTRRSWIQRLPAPIFLALCALLIKFDAKIMTVLSEGYEANF